MTFLQTLWHDHKLPIIAAAVALAAAASCLKIVDEKTQAVVVRLGQPDRVINRFRPD
ncbi:MAG: protease modulator HflC, partial [Novosphingobium sp.]|nr:protease modulator HflC [Novosphingobium sp.]